MCPSKVADGEQRGWIVPIGGAEDKESRRRILKRFVQLCGGREARIAVIPTASRLADTGERYEDLFERLEAGRVDTLDFQSRADGEREDFLEVLQACTGVFITGGNQLRLSTIIGGTPAAKLPDPTTHAEKAARMDRLLKTQEEFAFAATAAMAGRTVRVLVEAAGRNEGTVNGRLDNNLVVEFKAPESLIGQWADVHITGSRAALLVGELAE